MCVCVSEGSPEPAREWTLCIIPRTKNDGMNGDTYSVLIGEFCLMRPILSHMLSHCTEADSEGVRLKPLPPPVSKISYKNEIIWSQ